MTNPIAEVLDQTIPSVLADERRPLSGFIKFAERSVELERFQRYSLIEIQDPARSGSVTLYVIISRAIQIGFEAGKSYMTNGQVEKLLQMEDNWEKQQAEERAAAAANPPKG